MTPTDSDAASDSVEYHETSWSKSLESPRHADRERLLVEAIEAIEHTASGVHVNLVTHADHGHPSSYLFAHLRTVFDDRRTDIGYEYVDQCGCGGYVTRVDVER